MISDGIKAARSQSHHSPLIGSTWRGMAFQASVLSAVRHATGRLNPPGQAAVRPAAAARQAGTPRPGVRSSAATPRADLARSVPAPGRGTRRLIGS